MTHQKPEGIEEPEGEAPNRGLTVSPQEALDCECDASPDENVVLHRVNVEGVGDGAEF
jgi:hypothetical protein